MGRGLVFAYSRSLRRARKMKTKPKHTQKATAGQNMRARLEWIIALTVKGKTKEAVEEAKRLAKYLPRNITFCYTEKEKLAASIIDQLTPVWINETGSYIAPSTFKALTKRLAELL